MRLIDADKVEKLIKEHLQANAQASLYPDRKYFGLSEALEIVMLARTVDAVKIVRCRDCKWMDMVYLYCNWHDSPVEEDGYCYEGKREE